VNSIYYPEGDEQMLAGKIIGTVVATQKYESLKGRKLLLVQPMTWDKKPKGDPIVAVDTVGSGSGEFIFYVASARQQSPAEEHLWLIRRLLMRQLWE